MRGHSPAFVRIFPIALFLVAIADAVWAINYILSLEPPLADAAVYVDGEFAGVTDENGKIVIMDRQPGSHAIRVQAPDVDVTAEYTFDADLNDLPPFQLPDANSEKTPPARRNGVRYVVESSVGGAAVLVDDVVAGLTDSRDGTAAIELTPGRRYRVAVAKQGWRTEEQTVDAAAGGGVLRFELRTTGADSDSRFDDPLFVFLLVVLGGSVIVLGVVIIAQRRREPRLMNTQDPMVGDAAPIFFDRYQLVSTLGSGGVGMIYRAMDVVEKTTVALKVLDARWLSDPEMVRKFLSEGEALQAVAERDPHAAVVRCYRHGREHASIAGRPFIALELLEGETLERRLKREPVMQELTAIGIAYQISVALASVHGAGIVHRDLTPDNIFLKVGEVTLGEHLFAGVPQVVLIDFGIARLDIASKVTMDGSIAGKPQYMSPEQCRGLKVEARSDLYSLGIIMFLIVSGHTPFEGRDPFEVMRAQQSDTPPVLPAAVSASYAGLTRRLLQKNPSDRPSSAAMVSAELQSLFFAAGAVPPATNLVTFPERRLLP